MEGHISLAGASVSGIQLFRACLQTWLLLCTPLNTTPDVSLWEWFDQLHLLCPVALETLSQKKTWEGIKLGSINAIPFRLSVFKIASLICGTVSINNLRYTVMRSWGITENISKHTLLRFRWSETSSPTLPVDFGKVRSSEFLLHLKTFSFQL